MRVFAKTPDEVLDYGWDWSQWLGGDTIQTSVWVVDAGLTVPAQGNDSTSTTLWAGAGTLGMRYKCANRIITVGGRTAVRTFHIEIVENKYA